jgi:outer membrane immunogenic protein
MKKLIITAAAVSLMGVAAPSFAQTLDGSVAYSSVDTDEASVGAVTGRLSWTSANIFGVEGEASFGVNDDRVTVAGVPTDVELKYSAAVYGTANVPFSDRGKVFARVGYGTQKVEATAAGVTADGSDQSWNYGVGAQYLFDGANGIRADYTKHDFNDGGDADVWSVGYVRRF